MSTPISQGSKLTGLELYAPHRADVQSEPISVTSPQRQNLHLRARRCRCKMSQIIAI